MLRREFLTGGLLLAGGMIPLAKVKGNPVGQKEEPHSGGSGPLLKIGAQVWMATPDFRRRVLTPVPYRVVGRFMHLYADGSGRRSHGWTLLNLGNVPGMLPGSRLTNLFDEGAESVVSRTPQEAVVCLDALLHRYYQPHVCEECGSPARLELCDRWEAPPQVDEKGVAWDCLIPFPRTNHLCMAHAREPANLGAAPLDVLARWNARRASGKMGWDD